MTNWGTIWQILLSEQYKTSILPETAWRGYGWFFYADAAILPGAGGFGLFSVSGLDIEFGVERFGPYNSSGKMFDPNLRWFVGYAGAMGSTQWLAFRNVNDAVECKLIYGNKVTSWKYDE